jgi:DNA repair protein RadC
MFGKPAPVDPDELARRQEVKDLEAKERTLNRPQKEEHLFTVLNKKLNRQGLLKQKADIPKDRMDKISAPRGGGKLLEDMIGDGELDEFLPFDMRVRGLAGQLSPDELLDREQRGFEHMLDKLASNNPLTYENEIELKTIGYDLDQLTQEGKLDEVNRELQAIADEELLARTEATAITPEEGDLVGPEGAPGTEAARQAAQQAGVAPSLFGEEEAKEPAAKIKAGLTRYASGMSGISDLETGAYTRAGYGRNGIGVDVSLLSKSATDALANAILNYRTPAFIDSGAFSAFRKQIKGQPVDPIDFDRVLAKYDEILTKIGELNPEERQDYPRPRFVMPDVVGDQDASVGLVNRYKNWIATEVRGNLSDPIVPIQKGPRSLSEVYDEISNILGTRDFIVGVPSQEEAISKADLAEFLKASQPTKIHFLGAASDKKLNPLLALVAQHSPNTEVSADASKVRSSILSGVAQGKTREQAIQDALRAEDDPYEVFNRYMEQASAPQEAAPKETRAAPAAESDVDKLAEAFPNVPRDLFEGVGSFAKVKPYIQAAYNKGNLKQIETILNSLRKAAPPIGQVREPTPEEKRLADLERDLFRLTPPTTPELRAAPSAQADLFGVAGLESLPDRPQLQKQKRENNQQLSLFGSKVIDSSENNTAGRKARKAAIDEVKALQETDTTMGLSFADEFAKKQRANLVGQKINSASDLAVLSQVYRDPRFETFRLFFTDADNNVISQLGVTSRLPGSSNAIIGNDLNKYLVEVQKAAKDVGAVGFWMLHNHPSGNVQSSGADRVLTKTFNKYMPGMNFLGHVIIDTNKYGLILPDGTYTEISKDMNQKDLVDFQLGSYETVFNPIEMAKKVDEDQNAMVLVVMNNSLQVTGITSLPNSDFVGKTPEQIQRRLMKTALRGMGSRLLVASRNREALDAVASSVENGIHIKDNGQYENFNQMFKYRTILTFPLSRPGVVTADSSKLFDFLRKPKVADPGRSKYLNWTDLRVLEPQKEMFGDDVLSKLDKLPKDKSKLPPGRSPELAEITQRFVRGEVSRAERDEAVEKFKKVRVWEEVLEPATDEQMRNALNVVQRQKVNAPIPEGTKVGTRIDILAARKYGVQVVTIHEAKANVKSPMPGTAISYRNVAKLRNAKFAIGSEQKALDIAEGEKKDAIQTIEGYLVDITPAEAKREMEKALSDSEYIQIGFDPTAHSYFYDRVTKLPVISADEIIQIGNQVLAKGVEFQEAETFLYNITEDQGHLFEGEGVEKVDSIPAGVKKKVKKGRSPELAEMAEKLKRGEITKEDYDEAVNKFSRPALYAEIPKPATDKAVVDALSSDKRPYANVAISNGTKVGLRLDIPAFERYGVGVVSIHQAKPSLTSPKADKILSYRSVAGLKNVKFALGDQTKALNTAAGEFKDKLQTMEGEYVNYTPEEAFAKAKEVLNDPEYIQVGFNPIRHSYFYDRLTMLPVVSADEVIQIGQLVMAKGVEFGDKADFLYNIGDPVPLYRNRLLSVIINRDREEILNFYQGLRQRRAAALVRKIEEGEVSIDIQRKLKELNELGKEMQLDASHHV